MTSTRPSFSSSRRPSSAIFIGGAPPPQSSSSADIPHSPSSPRSQLPSPPATNSGSTGDSNSTGSIGRTRMVNGSKRSSDEEDDTGLEYDEDTTAKLSGVRGKDGEPGSSTSTLQRVTSLTERNRKLLDRVSSITSGDSHSRSSLSPLTSSKASSIRSRSPLPPTTSASTSSPFVSSNSRVSFPGPSSFPGGSGSETEREAHPSPQVRNNHNLDGDATATLSASRRRYTSVVDATTSPVISQRSGPSSPLRTPSNVAPDSPRKRTTTFSVIGSGRRARTVSIQSPGEEDEPPESVSRTSSASKRARAPLPREFRDRRSFDGRSAEESSTSSQNTQDRNRLEYSPTTMANTLVARGMASASAATFSGSQSSPRRPARAATVRESVRRNRWSSVDEGSLSGRTDENDPDESPSTRRQFRKTGSAESPLGGKETRSVVGEGLRAAGLTRRATDDVFADGVPQRRTRLSGGLGSRPSLNGSREVDAEDLRTRIGRAGIAQQSDARDRDRPPLSAVSSRYNSRNPHTALSNIPSRAATSLAIYGDDDPPRSASANRTFMSGLPDRASSRAGLQNDRQSSPFGRPPSSHQAPTSAEHTRLMLDSLAMFESQLARIPTSSTAPDLTRVAQTVVQSASGLNNLLRAGNTHALEQQIEAEVGDSPRMVDASEIWRSVGAEYRETLRMSDELVRTMTQLLLGVGRIVRESARHSGTDSPDISGSVTSGRSSLDGSDISRPVRRSTGLDGRRSSEFPLYRESRRSLDAAGAALRMTPVDGNGRPSTAQSNRQYSDEDEETAREQNRSSALERLTVRRVLTPRLRDNRSPAPQELPASMSSQPSPSPAPRYYEHREQIRSLPPLSVPPPLATLPSESLLEERRNSTRRRSKFSNTSTATVRGSSVFSPITTPNPTTAVTPQTAKADVSNASHPDVSSALSGLQERDVRKRTLSAASAVDSSSGSSRRVPRASLDDSSLASTSPENSRVSLPGEQRRERRRTFTEVLS